MDFKMTEKHYFDNFFEKKRLLFNVKGSPENSRQINRKFGVEFSGDSIANLYQLIDNISNIAWVYIKMFWNENSGTL